LHEHISNCTWIGDSQKNSDAQSDPIDCESSGSTLTAAGLLFKLKAGKKCSAAGSTPRANSMSAADETAGQLGHKPVLSKVKATTSKFMATVAAKFLMLTEEERKEIPLVIEGKEKGTFDSICMRIQGYHPVFQPKRIYYGRAQVHELTNVFFIKFLNKVNLTGKKTERNSKASINLSKQWLDLHDILSDQPGGV